MNHFEIELEKLRADFIGMWELVSLQLKRAEEALGNNDVPLAGVIVETENTVNDQELRIAKSCENIIALYNPVARDLRFILALIKINSSLERAGDIAYRIAKYVIKSGGTNEDDRFVNRELVQTMFGSVCNLLDDTLVAFREGDTQKARMIFRRDEKINEANKAAYSSVIASMKANPARIEKYLKVPALLRRIEKAGDISKSIAEEIVFYIEAKVLRHSGLREQIREKRNKRVLAWVSEDRRLSEVLDALEESGYGVMRCGSEKGLLSLLEQYPKTTRLVIIDTTACPGYAQCIRTVKASVKPPHVMIVGTESQKAAEQSVLGEGADFYVPGSFKPGILLKRIEVLLTRAGNRG